MKLSRQDIIDGLTTELEDVRPSAGGVSEQQFFAYNPELVNRFRFPQDLVLAAVLVAIVQRETDFHVFLTVRSSDVPDHAGDVVFPGGKLKADETVVDAALREAREEVGLDRESVEVAGFLASQPIATGYLIQPVLGFVHPEAELVADEREVAEIFEVPLSFVFDRENHHRHLGEFGGGPRSFPAVTYAGRLMWGTTVHVLLDLSERVGRAARP